MTASRLFILTVSGILGSLVGCSPEQTFSGPPQNNSQGGGNQTSSGTETGGANPTTGGVSSQDTTAPAQGGAATGGAAASATGGAANPTGGTTGSGATGGTKATTGGTKATTGGTKATTGGTKATTGGTRASTGGRVATGGAVSDPTGGAAATGGTTAAVSLTECTFGSALTVTTSDGYVSTAATAANGTCGGYSFSWTSQCSASATATGTTTISPCTDTSATKCPASITEKKFTPTGGLCATGSISGCSDYSATIGFGFNLNQAPASSTTGTLAQSGTGLQIKFSGTKPTSLRVQVSDDSGLTKGDYCYDISTGTSPVKIPWGSFAYQCWDTAAVPLPATALITKIQFIIPSAETKASSFSDLCITGVSSY
jgi:hypothetical protein